MEQERIEQERKMCKELYHKNKGGCNWGKCKDCGVLPLLHKLETGTAIEDAAAIKALKETVFEDNQYL